MTTLTDAEVYTKADIAELYGFRWNAELDIRATKQNLNLNHVRGKSPEMVRRELWTTLLAYNLVRTTAAASALLHGKRPGQIRFTGTCQYISLPGLIWRAVGSRRRTSRTTASRCCPRSPSAKSPTVPAESNPASSNAAATATNSCNNHEPSSKHNSKTPTAKHDST